MDKTILLHLGKVSLVTIVVMTAVFTVNYLVLAFAEPGQAPPGCTAGQPGCDAPLNVGGTAQTKTGNLGIGAAPSEKLTVQSSSGGRGVININQVGVDNWSGLKIDREGAEKWFIGMNATNDSLRFRLNGADPDRLVIDTSGRVGIGTTAPQQKLHVTTYAGTIPSLGNEVTAVFSRTGDANAISSIAVIGGNSGGSTINFGDTDAYFRGRIEYSHSSDKMSFYTAASGAQMTIDSSGRVGIGTPSPRTNLEVRGTTGYPATSGTTPVGIFTIDTTNDNNIYFGSANASPWGGWIQVANDTGLGTYYPLLLNPNGGNVGIGTTSPGDSLHIAHATLPSISLERAGIGAGRAFIQIENDGTNNWLTLYGHGPSQRRIKLNNVLYITDTAGKVGIGTPSPGYKLDVQDGQINTSGGLCIAGVCKTDWSQVGGTQWTTSGNNIYNSNSGNVGIGTPGPSTILALERGGRFMRSNVESTGNVFMTFGSPASNSTITQDLLGDDLLIANNRAADDSDITFTAGGPERLRITGAGSVGIGIVNPASKLHIKDGQAWGSDLSIDATGTTGGRRWLLISTGGNAAEGPGKFLIKDNTGGVRMTIDTLGNVGIGTTSPDDAKLEVVTTGDRVGIFEDNDSPYLLLRDSGNAADQELAGLRFGAGGTRRLDIVSSNDAFTTVTEYISVDTSNGNVGIGTPDPLVKLEVNGDVRVAADEAFIARYAANDTYRGLFQWQGLQLGNNGANYIVAGNTAAGGRLHFVVNNTNDLDGNPAGHNGTEALTILSNGNVAIAKDLTVGNNDSIPEKIKLGNAEIYWDGTRLVIKVNQ